MVHRAGEKTLLGAREENERTGKEAAQKIATLFEGLCSLVQREEDLALPVLAVQLAGAARAV